MPPLPFLAEGAWRKYRLLHRRRGSGMEANPVSYTELEAFKAATRTFVSGWEADLIMRMDDAALAAWRADAADAQKTPDERAQISMKNPKGILALMRGMRSKKDAEMDAREAKGAAQPASS